jgi:protein-S-isoprenylcysteine O-methyltransferase Ste14
MNDKEEVRFVKKAKMDIKNSAVESFLKSFAFSLLLCLYVGYSAVTRTQSLLNQFDWIELLRLVYCVSASLFFLVRSKPSIVSMNPVHWGVALLTSFSAHFLIRSETENELLVISAKVMICVAAVIGTVCVLALGRSFGLLPALRKIKTNWLYRVVRHPMYTGAMLFKMGYVLKNPSLLNIVLLLVIAFLYDRRAKYEEVILSHDESYESYVQRVKYRFIPGLC